MIDTTELIRTNQDITDAIIKEFSAKIQTRIGDTAAEFKIFNDLLITRTKLKQVEFANKERTILIQNAINDIKREEYNIASNTLDPTSQKPLYSNESKRNSAADIAVKQNETFQAHEVEILLIKNKLINIEYGLYLINAYIKFIERAI